MCASSWTVVCYRLTEPASLNQSDFLTNAGMQKPTPIYDLGIAVSRELRISSVCLRVNSD